MLNLTSFALSKGPGLTLSGTIHHFLKMFMVDLYYVSTIKIKQVHNGRSVIIQGFGLMYRFKWQ